MTKLKFMQYLTFSILLVLFVYPNHLYSQTNSGKKEYIKIEVDGLACPFCAYGLEKNLNKNIDGIENLDINVEEGYVTFGYPKEIKLKDEMLKDIVKDAGFKANQIYFSGKPFIKKGN